MGSDEIDHEEIEPAREFLRAHGDRILPWSRVLIAAEALSRGLNLDYVQQTKQLTISRGNVRYYFRGLSTNYNASLARRLCRLRAATSKYLMAMGQPALENCVFEAGEEETAWEWSQKILPVSVQADSRMRNLPVFGSLITETEFRNAYARIAEDQPEGILVQEDPPGTDYRAIVLNGDIVAVSHLAGPHVVGDGQRTVAQLLVDQNERYLPYRRRLELGDSEVDFLARTGLSPVDVPDPGQRVYLSFQVQAHSTSFATDATDTLGQDHVALIQQAAGWIPGLRLAGVATRIVDNAQGGRFVLTGITARPHLAAHQFPQEGQPRNVAKAILGAMFPPM